MPAPKHPNTAAATATKRRMGDETAAARLRDHGWIVVPPELVADAPPGLIQLAVTCVCCSCCAELCPGCAHGSRKEILSVPHVGEGHVRAYNVLIRQVATAAEATVSDDQVDRYSMGELTELGGIRRAVAAIYEAKETNDG